MASFTVTRQDLFPNGTSVAAYLTVSTGRTPTSGAPAGTAVETQSMTSGALTFSALEAGKTYILYAGSPDRYLRVNTSVDPDPAQSGSGSGGRTLAWDGSSYQPAEYLTDTSQPREFVGPVDPTTLEIPLVFGDRWTPTEEPA